MIVVGNNCQIIEDTGMTVQVKPFTEQCQTLDSVPIVNAVIKYTCPVSDESYLLMIMNVIHVPSMQHNLIPPFILREAGIIVNDVPKIHKKAPTNDDHCIIVEEHNLKIPLRLTGMFSYFESTKPSQDESIQGDEEDIIYLYVDVVKKYLGR